jgi:hypothetical protein
VNKKSSVIARGIPSERRSATAAELRAAGIEIARDFPGSSLADFKAYPVLSEGGWYLVVKHQPTLTTVQRERWRLLGPIELTSEGLDI